MDHSTQSARAVTRRSLFRGATAGTAGLAAGLLFGFRRSQPEVEASDDDLGRMIAYVLPHRDFDAGIPNLEDRQRLAALVRLAKGFELVLDALEDDLVGFDALDRWDSREAIFADVESPALASLMTLASIGRVVFHTEELSGARDSCHATVVSFTTEEDGLPARYRYACHHPRWAHMEGVCLRCADPQSDEPDFWQPSHAGQVVEARHDFEPLT